jgi:outer membrane protein
MAALLPNISLSGQTTWNEYYQLGELQNEYNSFSQAARISQPLLRLDTWFNFRRSKFLTDASEADFAFQQQNLIVRTAELYFNVLRSIDNLNAAISEEVAIKKQLDQTKQRYEVGLSAITEVQEAQLAYDVSLAAKIRREGEVFTAREALNALVGREIVSVDALVNEMRVTNPVPDSKDDWVQKGIENNFRLKAANLRTKASKNNARSAAANHLPKIDIVGSRVESETNQFSSVVAALACWNAALTSWPEPRVHPERSAPQGRSLRLGSADPGAAQHVAARCRRAARWHPDQRRLDGWCCC